MEKDKLEKAAVQNKHRQYWTKHSHKKSFENGAEWLMGQPIAERMTEEEKKKIRQLHNDAELFADAESVHKVEMSGAIYLGRLMALDMIFGKEMFENIE